MEKDTLNKKLVEDLLGFEVTQVFMPDGWVPFGRICFYTNEMVEDGFGGKEKEYETSDLFTYSLDACFKWLVPKLIYCSLTKMEKAYGDNYWLSEVRVEENGRGHYGDAIGKEPALTLCLAMGRLINETSS